MSGGWRGLAGMAALAAAGLAMLVAEKRRALRRPTQPEPQRTMVNLALGALATATMTAVEQPLSDAATRLVERRRFGLAQLIPSPTLRDVAGFLLMDYATYGWHVLTHKAGPLWRLHLVHHVDMDLDTTTALRFHAVDMAVSAPARALQIVALGVSPRAMAVWRPWFLFAVLFHHSNLALPPEWDRRLAWVVTTPRMHGIHHSASRALTDSNWSSGLSLWDRLHRTFRYDEAERPIGVPAYRRTEELGVALSLALPFRPQRDDWAEA